MELYCAAAAAMGSSVGVEAAVEDVAASVAMGAVEPEGVVWLVADEPPQLMRETAAATKQMRTVRRVQSVIVSPPLNEPGHGSKHSRRSLYRSCPFTLASQWEARRQPTWYFSAG